MITANFIHRTFRIRCDECAGTAFTVAVDGMQYLITARHVVKQFTSKVGLDIFRNGQWTSVPVEMIGQGKGEIDISVFAPKQRLSLPDLPVTPTSDGIVYGQDVYFLGFPYDFLGHMVFTEDKWPLPFVKHAIVSLFDRNVFLLDGHNNRGFSGGPVVFGDSVPTARVPTRIGAVISGYKRANEEVLIGEGIKTELATNTGIIIAYKIELALDLIRANPIGSVADD